MNQDLTQKAAILNKAHKRHKRAGRVKRILALVIVLATVYALMMPAITATRQPLCGLEEHQHTDACYEMQDVLVCTLEQTEAHTHTEECCGSVPGYVCGLEACEPHVHDESCYTAEQVLSCGQEASDGHSHSGECYQRGALLCPLAESEEHSHDDSCYECLLVCTLAESTGHQHSELCYTPQSILTCTLSTEGHTHSDACLGEVEGLICGKTATEGHTHGEECYEQQRVLICGKEEHSHSDGCYPQSDDSANVETAEIWEATLSGVTLTGDYATDLVNIAASQLGYTESAANFRYVDEEIKGYSRYGAWYGDPYGDWCAMFVSFCLRYADIPAELIPSHCACAPWAELLAELGRFMPAEGFTPRIGDIIFLDTDGTDISNTNHVGIVESVTDTTITTIEGNICNVVGRNEYPLDSAAIYGYGLVSAYEKKTVLTFKDDALTAQLTVSGELPEDTVLHIEKLDPAENTAAWANMLLPTLEKQLERNSEAETPKGADAYSVKLLSGDQELIPDKSSAVKLELTVNAPVMDSALLENTSLQAYALCEKDAESESREPAAEEGKSKAELRCEALLAALELPEESEEQGSEETLPTLGADSIGETDVDETLPLTLTIESSGALRGFTLLAMPAELRPVMKLMAAPAPLMTLGSSGTATAPALEYHKQIDYLGDDTPDVTADDTLYRLYLSAGPLAQADPVDVLFIVDKSSSMGSNKLQNSDKYRWQGLSEILNGTSSSTGDISSGLISKILKMNSSSKVAAVWFSGQTGTGTTGSTDSGVLFSWTSTATYADCQPRSGDHGTNYNAGFLTAHDMLSSVASDGNEKLIIFLSDGEPTLASAIDISGATWTLGTRTGNGDSYTDAIGTASTTGINQFHTYLSGFTADNKATVYSVGIGSVNKNMENMVKAVPYNGGTASFDDTADGLLTKISSIVVGDTTTVKELVITDTLSNYVDMGGNITITAKDKTGAETTLYSRATAADSFSDTAVGDATVFDTTLLQTVAYDKTTKTITATFVPTKELDPDGSYTLSFDINTNATTALTYSNSGYNATGAADTDHGSNTTSSAKSGFFSNTTATASYRLSSAATATTVTYPMPVVQAVEESGGKSKFTTNGYITQEKIIDWLGDDPTPANNPDTDLDDGKTAAAMRNYYRLYLNAGRFSLAEPIDLLLVLDKSNSMTNEDMTGSGRTKLKRYQVIDEIVNGTSTTKGFIREFLDMNPDNQYAVVSFGGGTTDKDSYVSGNAVTRLYTEDAKFVTTDWTKTLPDSGIDCVPNNGKILWGTNYCAAMYIARDMLAKSTSGNKKLMVFISDGVPTFWMDSQNARYGNGSIDSFFSDGKEYSTGVTTKAQNTQQTKARINELKAAYPNMGIYCIGVAPEADLDRTLLNYLSTDATEGVFTSMDYDELLSKFENILYGGVGAFGALGITDTLSDYVELYASNADIKVTLTEGTTTSTLYQRNNCSGSFTDTAATAGKTGNFTANNSKDSKPLLKTVSYDATTKTISISFNPEVELNKRAKYELSYNVKTTQTAADTYDANLAAGKTAYDGVTGAANTDYGTNTSSSGQPGFHSNTSAAASYNLGTTPFSVPYAHPVVQTEGNGLSITVNKVWASSVPEANRKPVTVKLYSAVDGSTTLTPVMDTSVTPNVAYSVTLNAANSWTQTITGLSRKDSSGNLLCYYVVEDPLAGYLASYSDAVYNQTIASQGGYTAGKVNIPATPSSGLYVGTVTVTNTPGVLLPDTGGIGELWFIGGGLTLLLLGTSLLLRKKRRS